MADTSESLSPLDAVTQLMAERQKYEQWLRDLNAKREATPSHVFDRVHADYTTRLNEVQEQLSHHATDMQKHAATLVSRLRDLEAAERRLADERAEADLRSHVGEMSKSDFDAAVRRAERELSRIQQEQEKLADDLNQIRSIVEGRSDGDGDDDEEAPRRSTDFDELEFLKSVVGAHPATPEGLAASAGTTAPPATGARQDGGSPAAAASPAQTSPAPKSDEVTAATSPTPAPKKDSSLAANVTGNQPVVLRTSGVVEQPKTLKCAECGSMNYPSEWYCERCGAELTVI